MSTIRHQKLKFAQSSIDYTNLPTSNAYLLHHHCRLVCAQIQNLHPSTLPLESATQHRMRTQQRNCYSFQNLKLQPYTVDTKLWWQTLKFICQVHLGSVSQSVSQSSKLCGNFDSCFRSRQGVAKLCDMYTANCPIVYLTVPKLQGHKQLHELRDIVYWY